MSNSFIQRSFSLNPLARALRNAVAVAMIASATAVIPASAQAAQATFLVQLNDYDGENTYFTMYLVDPQGRYVRTLWVSGDEPRWHRNQSRWWKYLGRTPQDLDAITGASTAPGDRNIIHVNLDKDVLDKGYKVRVDTIVENQNNYPNDVETVLDSAHAKEKIPGTGYVRYLRYKWD